VRFTRGGAPARRPAPTGKPVMKNFWKSARRWLPGVIISLIAIAAILYFVDLQRFVDALRSANYGLLLAFAASSVVWLAVRGIVWRTLLRGRARYRDVFLTLSEGYLLNNFLPFRLGEVGRAFLLGRKANLGFMDVHSAEPIALVVGALVIVGLVVLYVLARNRDRALYLFDRLTARRPKLQKMGEDFLAPLFSGLAILTDGWLFVRFLLWMALDWVISILQFYLMLLAFFPDAQPIWSLFGLGAVAFGNAIPSMPGAIGTYEGALAGALTLVTHNESASLALAVTAHVFNYLVTGVIGLYALSNEGETLMGVYGQLRKRQEEPVERRDL